MSDYYFEPTDNAADEPHRVHVQPTDGGYKIRLGDVAHRVTLRSDDATLSGQIDLTIGDRRVRAYAAQIKTGEQTAWQIWLGGRVWTLAPTRSADQRRREAAGVEGALTATMPGQVRAVLVEAGQAVVAGEALLILEAMKMETKLTAPRDGEVAQIFCAEGDVVERGQKLVELT